MNAEHKHKNSIIPHSLNNLRHPPTSKDDGFAMNKNIAQFCVVFTQYKIFCHIIMHTPNYPLCISFDIDDNNHQWQQQPRL